MATSDRHIMQTFTGRSINLLCLKTDDICIEDIAHALAYSCRFAGHSKFFYSIAQHSVLVSRACDPDDALHGLFHDAAEFLVGDAVAPVKRLPALAQRNRLEVWIQKVISVKFGLLISAPASVKVADMRVLATEARDVMGGQAFDWELGVEPLDERIVPEPPHRAEQRFLERFAELTGPVPTLATAKAVAREALSGDRDLREAHEAILLLREDAGQ